MLHTMPRFFTVIFIVWAATASCICFSAGAAECLQQPPVQDNDSYMQFIIQGKDTVYVDDLPAARVYERLPRQKGREWRKYYRLVHNFSKVYPYALVARKIVEEVDSTIAADNLVRGRRDRYISQKQALAIIETRKPIGRFVLDTGIEIIGIDNETGDAWTEEFPDMQECLTWLCGDKEMGWDNV